MQYKKKIRGEKTHVKLQSGVFPIFVDDNKKLRDEFAMRAMHGMVTAFYSQETHHGWKHKEIAEEAYKLADAMLEEREAANTKSNGQ